MEFTLVIKADSIKNLRVGMQVKKDDIVKWQYVSPNSLEIIDILKAVEHNFKEDIKRFTKWFTHKTEYYLKEISEIYSKGGEEFRRITLIALSVPVLAFGVANTKFQPNKTIETIEVKKSDNVLVMSCNKTEIKAKREERKIIKKKVKMAATLKKIDNDIKKLEIKNKVQKLSPKKQAVTLLNQSEGLYVIPYWDYNQYSVGYGTYISYEECKILWDRMNITEEQGRDLAHEINRLQQKRGGFKKVKQILDKWSKHKGVLTEEEANKMREKEWSKFHDLVEENYTFLPELQKRILTNIMYNSGFAGLRGGTFETKHGKKVIPESNLSKLIRTRDWWDNDIYEEFTKFKVTIKGKWSQGLHNRRVLERDAWFSTVRKDSQENHIKNLEKSFIK